MSESVLQTEFEFTLPKGYVDEDGERHREGAMRLATAADEIKPLKDPRVRANEAYLTVIVLARVTTRLGTLEDVTPYVIENLYVTDLEHLQERYERINVSGADVLETTCPSCDESVSLEVQPGGEVVEVRPGGEAADGGDDPVSTGDRMASDGYGSSTGDRAPGATEEVDGAGNSGER